MALLLTMTHSPFAGVSKAFSAFFEGMISVMENHPRMKKIERLQALSDEQLAEIGLTRETIVRHVFRDSTLL
ncbi:MAG: DUF1127 domain-containing protein [Mangrovicoccus sp.]